MADDAEAGLSCMDCRVPLEVADIQDDSAHVVCPSCGKDFGAWGDVKAAILGEAAKQAQKGLKDAVPKGGNWKLTKR